jgi:hypothetical protein
MAKLERIDTGGGDTALKEGEVTRLVVVLEDYEHVSVSPFRDVDDIGFGLRVRDHRFGLDYEIASHHDYWDLIGALVDHRQYHALPAQRNAA